MQKVKGYENFSKSEETSVVVNNNMNEYLRHMRNKQNIVRARDADSKKIRLLEQQMEELRTLMGNK
jgi:hypothetical protein